MKLKAIIFLFMEGTVLQIMDLIRMIAGGGAQWFGVFMREFQSVLSPKDAIAFVESIGVLLTPVLALVAGYFSKAKGLLGGKFKNGLVVGGLAGMTMFLAPEAIELAKNQDGLNSVKQQVSLRK
jgi:hypothetical protein